MKKSFYLLITIAIALSCARITFHDSENKLDINKADESNTCQIKRNPIYLYSDNQKLNDQYSKFVQTHRLSTVESMLYWNIIQLSSRPDATTINSQILSIFKINGKLHQVVYIPKDQNQATFIPYLKDLTQMSKKVSLSSSLKKLMRLNKSDEQVRISQIPISHHMEKYLEANKVSLYKNKKLRSIYFKGNQLIRTGETIPLINMSNVFTASNKLGSNFLKLEKLFDHPKKFQCNFDHRLYKNSAPILERTTQAISSNYFGLFKDKNNFFITITSSLPEKHSLLKDQLLIKSKKINQFNAAICVSNNERSIVLAKNIIHSEQLLNNILMNSNSLNPRELINSKRFINLKYPIRSLIEIYGEDNLKAKNLESTIYNIPTLGRVDIIDTTKSPMLYRDPRRSDLTCN